MRVRAGTIAIALAVGALVAAEGAVAQERCRADGRSCMRVDVPLDRSGAVPGAISLRVERSRARRPVRPPLFAIAGGPGQSTTRAFPTDRLEELIGRERHSRDLVAVDLRGTGGSGALRCPSLRDARNRADLKAAAAACGASLGLRRDFYTSVDMADDIDAVRQALGAPKIALYGVSYGTHVALTYARRHPDRVERLALESVVGADGVDPLGAASMRAAPRAVRAFCGGRCRGFTRDAGADVATLAARLAGRPLRGRVARPGGALRRSRIDATGLLDTIVAGDLDPVLRATLPGAIRNALRGDPAPLLRSQAWASDGSLFARSDRAFSAGAYAATICGDVRLPWDGGVAKSDRRARAEALVAAMPADAFAPFGADVALDSAVLALCEGWPTSGRPAQPRPDLPDVPALLLAGGLDVRTPVADAQAVAALFPRARLLRIPNAGHGVMGWHLGSCPEQALGRFLAGGEPGRCSPAAKLLHALPPPPRSFAEVSPPRGVAGRRGRTLGAVGLTVIDGYLSLARRMLSGFESPRELVRFVRRPFAVGALRGGSYVFVLRRREIRLRRAVLVPGVRVSGRLRWGKRGRPRGVLNVAGRRAVRGRLNWSHRVVTGRLGGRRVRAATAPRPEAAVAVTATTHPSLERLPLQLPTLPR